MALDPSISLGVKPIQLPNPLEIMSTVAQIQNQREQADALVQAGQSPASAVRLVARQGR